MVVKIIFVKTALMKLSKTVRRSQLKPGLTIDADAVSLNIKRGL